VTELILYITLSIAWSVGMFILGYFLGVKGRKELGEPVTQPLSEDTTVRETPWWRRTATWIGGLVALIGFGTLSNYYVFDAQTSEIVRCQEIWTNGFASALEARTKAQVQVTEAQDELWRIMQRGLSGAPNNEVRAQFQAQLNRYLEGREQAKASPPYPEAPRDLCS
jgi:hypothetical protein